MHKEALKLGFGASFVFRIAGLLRHHLKGRADEGARRAIGEDAALGDVDGAAGFDEQGFEFEPIAFHGLTHKVDMQANGHQARRAFVMSCTRQAHRIVSDGRDQSTVDKSPRITMLLASGEGHHDAHLSALGIKRLPWISERAFSEMRFKTSWDSHQGTPVV